MAIDLHIRNFIPVKHKVSPKGWLTFNAPCCRHNGEKADTRGRGGLIINGNDWSAHCFNCGFKVRYVHGQILSYRARRYLKWLGVDESVIQLMVIESLKSRSVDSIIRETISEDAIKLVEFEKRSLPESAILLTAESDQYYTDYILKNRGLQISDYPFMIMPDDPGRARHSILIPFIYDNKIVGHTKRFLDNKIPKYLSDQQSDYIFGTDMQRPDWKYIIVVEGPFDAIAVNGVALLNNEISDAQADLLESFNKEIVVVPDMNKPGLTIIDRAIELGWGISLPEWDHDIVDVNDAFNKYGKYYTVATIIAAIETHPIKIEMKKRKTLKRIAKYEDSQIS